jgi:NADH-quinone oxidoreductase subunit C
MLPEGLSEIPVVAALLAFDREAVTGGSQEQGQLVVMVDPAKIVAVCRILKEAHQFNRLSAITAVDWYPSEPRFEVVYQLHSLPRSQRLRVKCRLAEGQEIDSVYGVWRAADWYEREVFDLFGIAFRNHPNLKRIMLPEDWEGYPLRKDYPVHGFKYSYQDE